MLAKAGHHQAAARHGDLEPDRRRNFQQIVAKLTVDNNGKRGDEPGFDPKNVKTYGLGFDPGGLTYGQTTWAGFAASLGFKLLNKNPWGTQLQLRRPALRADVHLVAEHDPQGLHALAGTGAHARPVRGVPERQGRDGDRRRLDDRHLLGHQGVKVGYAPQPAGPKGCWSMYNGLADAIWVGTKHKPEARKWVASSAAPPARASSAPRPSCSRRSRARSRRRWRPTPRPGRRRQRVHVLHQVRPHGALPDHRQGAADQPDRAADAGGVPQRHQADAATVVKKMNAQVNNQLKYSTQ